MRFAKTASPDEVGWMPSLQGRTPVWRKKLNAFAYRFGCLGKCLFLKGILWRMACANAFWRYGHGRCEIGEHTSELQSPCNLVCRLLLEKKNICDHISDPAFIV